jgi:hypothetical protein
VPTAKKKSLSPKQAAARRVASQKKVKDSARKVKEGREAAEAAARDMEVTKASDWAQSVAPVGTKVLLPSGNVCLAYNPGIEAFIQTGAIPNALMPAVMEAINSGKGIEPSKAQEMSEDPEMLRQILDFADAATVQAVLEPEVQHVPEDGKRKPGILYVDKVDIADKMFLLQWVIGGTRDLERFREQSASALGLVAEGKGVGEETE